MTESTQTPADQKTSPAGVLAKLANFFQKSVSQADLKDIEDIVSVVDDHVQPHTMPSTTEVDTARGQSMRGFEAAREVDAHSNLLTQEGLTKMYDEFNRRMSEMMKSFEAAQAKGAKNLTAVASTVKSLVDSIHEAVKAEKDSLDKTRAEMDSAEDEAAKAVTAKKVEKAAKETALAAAFRKARIALRKAEDMDDDEDAEEKEEMMEKANETIVALNAAVAKAEDDAEDDKEEEKAEKARTDFRALKTSLKKLVAKKAAKPVVKPADKPVAEITKDEFSAMLNDWASSKGVPVSEVFARFGAPVDNTKEPPTFAKAYADKAILTPLVVAKRIEDATESDLLRDNEILKADSLKNRLRDVQAGRCDPEAFAHEVSLASTAVQAIFTLPQAA